MRGYGSTRGAYLGAIMASILVIGGFSLAIGILGGGELRGEGVCKGLLRMSPEVEWETREGLRRRLTSSSQQVLLFV